MGVASSSFFEPIDPFEGRIFDIVKFTPGAAAVNDLGRVQPDDGFGERVVVGVADAADRRLDARLRQALRITNREILATPVAVMDPPLTSERAHKACSKASRTRSVCIERATRQLMMRRAKTSMTKAT